MGEVIDMKDGKVVEVEVNKGGQPRIFNSPEQLKESFISYLADCKIQGKVPTIMGFALFNGIHRDTFYHYKLYNGYFDTIKVIEEYLEEATAQAMFTAKNPAGYIFYMKNKFGYTDKTEITIDQSEETRSPEQLLEDYQSKMAQYNKLIKGSTNTPT